MIPWGVDMGCSTEHQQVVYHLYLHRKLRVSEGESGSGGRFSGCEWAGGAGSGSASQGEQLDQFDDVAFLCGKKMAFSNPKRSDSLTSGISWIVCADWRETEQIWTFSLFRPGVERRNASMALRRRKGGNWCRSVDTFATPKRPVAESGTGRPPRQDLLQEGT